MNLKISALDPLNIPILNGDKFHIRYQKLLKLLPVLKIIRLKMLLMLPLYVFLRIRHTGLPSTLSKFIGEY